jgi:hypothetical protein
MRNTPTLRGIPNPSARNSLAAERKDADGSAFAQERNAQHRVLPMLDMWTDVFASPGWRITGTQAQTLLVVPPRWKPDLRERLIDEFKLPKDTQRIDAPTPYVWIIGPIKTDGPSDYDAVHKSATWITRRSSATLAVMVPRPGATGWLLTKSIRSGVALWKADAR